MLGWSAALSAARAEVVHAARGEQRVRYEARRDDEGAGREHPAEEAPAADVGGDDGREGREGVHDRHSRRALDGRADALIRAAAADVAGHRLVDLGVGRARLLGEERRGLHDLAGLAVAALRDVGRDPRALHGMGLAAAEALDRDDLASGQRAHRRLARAHGLAVHVHGAGAAEAAAAPVFRAGETQSRRAGTRAGACRGRRRRCGSTR